MNAASGASRIRSRYMAPPGANRDRWMVSYMDIVTILLILFVAIAAQSLQHPALQHPVKLSIAAPVPPPVAKPAVPPPVIPASGAAPARPRLLEAQQKLKLQGLDSKLEPRGLVISLSQAILFDSGQDRVSPQAQPVVRHIADVLRDLPNNVRLIGHSDDIPIHNGRFQNNWELSAARGLRLLEVLSRDYRIPESRLSVASDGAYNPLEPNDSPDGRAGNRRVEIVILDQTGE
ncbi:MAG: flagellar motor protein MotB [Bryobacteraceae bacterium]